MTAEQYDKAKKVLEDLDQINYEIERAKGGMKNPFGYSSTLDNILTVCTENCIAALESRKKELLAEFASI